MANIMNLYMVHVGYYDKNIGDGIYEVHLNYFVAAQNPKEAKTKTQSFDQFKEKYDKMYLTRFEKLFTKAAFKTLNSISSSKKQIERERDRTINKLEKELDNNIKELLNSI